MEDDDILFRGVDWAISQCNALPRDIVYIFTKPGMLDFLCAIKDKDHLEPVVAGMIAEKKLVFVRVDPLPENKPPEDSAPRVRRPV